MMVKKVVNLSFVLIVGILLLSSTPVGNKSLNDGRIHKFLGGVDGAGLAEAEEELVSFNFDNADIRLIIQLVGELTQTNFVYDEAQVSGSVTVSCPKKIAVGDTYRALESILEVKGLAMVASGELVKIVTRADAKLKSVDIRVGKGLEGVTRDDRIFTQVVRLEHADVQEVWKIIGPLVPKEGSVVISSQTNTIVITDTSSNIYRLLKIIQEMDKEAPASQKRIYVYSLQNADPEELAKVLSGIKVEQAVERRPRRPAARQAATTAEEKPEIVADKFTNSLVITALPRDYEVLEEVIRKLDVRRDQVLIEVLIAEVTLDKLSELGTELATWDEPVEGSETIFGGTSYDLREAFKTGELSGGVLGVMRGSKIGAIINYYKKDSDFNILQAPYLVTRDNEEAEILIGKNVPYVTKSRVTETDTETPTVIKTYEYKDVGIKLKITPHISPSGFVRLEVYQLIEKLAEGTGQDTPTTVKREISNTVEVRDGSTVVIGGLIRDDKETVVYKVPLLGDIPIIGLFFRKSREISEKTSLLILITPHVIRTPEHMEEITREKKKEGEAILPGKL